MTGGELLLRWAPAPAAMDRPVALAHALASHSAGFGRIDLQRAVDGSRVHLYAALADGSVPTEALRDELRRIAEGAEVVRLSPLEERAAVSTGRDAPFHYVVESDAEGADADAVRDWYVGEHLAGLAACEGTVRARRLANLDGGPRSFACYDLVSLAVPESPAWLAVRATDWASRVRPLFRNTRRTRFERVLTLPGNRR